MGCGPTPEGRSSPPDALNHAAHAAASAGPSRLVSILGAAAYLSTTPRSVYNLIARGVLRPVRFRRLRRTFIDRTELDDLIEEAKR